jgi:hypothetical protein
VRAGDRTPDVVFRDAGTDEETTLFGRLSRSRPVALFGLDTDAGDVSVGIRRSMEALGRLGVECSLVLPEAARLNYDGEALIDGGQGERRLTHLCAIHGRPSRGGFSSQGPLTV